VNEPSPAQASPRPAPARWDPRGWPWWAQTLGVYAVSRAWLVGVFVWVARLQEASAWTPASPSYLDYVGYMFDGSWYRQIAEQGYPAELPVGADGLVQQNAWAFFPAFPGLVRAVMEVTGGTWVVVAPLVATVLGALAVLVVHRVVTEGAPRAVEAWPGLPLATVALVCAFPPAAVLQAAYTESLALLLVAATLWAMVRRQYALAAVLMVALGFTRAVALPMVVVVVVHALVRWQARRRGERFDRWQVAQVTGLGVVAVLSGLVWPWLTGRVTGVPDGYLLTQEAWRGSRSTTPFVSWTWVPEFWLGPWAVPALMAGFGLVVALLVSRSAWRLGPELHAWSAGYLGYIVAVVEPGSSLARFLLLAFPMGTITAGLVTGRAWARRAWLAGVLVAMLALQVLWVRQIWLFNPAGDWPP